MRLLIFILLFPLFAQSQIIRANNYYTSATISSCDADAQKFIDSAGITDATQKSAICTLVKQLKDSSLWSSMIAIYPFVGGTSSTCKWNLKDPQNTDAAFRLTFAGTWTFASTGATPNGASGTYADTHLVPNTTLSKNHAHLSYYSRTNDGNGISMGANNVTGVEDSSMLLACKTATVYSHADLYSSNNGAVSGTGRAINGGNLNAAAYFLASRTSSTDMVLYRNASNIAQTSGSVSGSVPIISIYLGGFSGAVPAGYDNTDTKEVAFCTIGSGLSAAQVATLYNIVQAFQTTLGRNV